VIHQQPRRYPTRRRLLRTPHQLWDHATANRPQRPHSGPRRAAHALRATQQPHPL